MKYIKEVNIKNETILTPCVKVGWSDEPDCHVLSICVPGAEEYERYYWMTPTLYQEALNGNMDELKKRCFYGDAFEYALKSPIDPDLIYGTPVCSSWFCSTSLRDYEISRFFIKNATSGMYDVGIHQGYLRDHGRMFAHIVWNGKHYAVPPRFARRCNDENGGSEGWDYVFRYRDDVKRYKYAGFNGDYDYMLAIPVDDFEGYEEWEKDFKKEAPEDAPEITVGKTKAIEFDDNGELKLIFYEEDMGWEEWVKSKYNTEGYYLSFERDSLDGELCTHDGYPLAYYTFRGYNGLGWRDKVNSPVFETFPLVVRREYENKR